MIEQNWTSLLATTVYWTNLFWGGLLRYIFALSTKISLRVSFLGDIVDVDVMYPTRQSGQRGQTAHCTQDERSGHGAVEAFRCPWVLLDNHSLFSHSGCVLLCHAIFYICYLGHGYFFPKPLVLCVCAWLLLLLILSIMLCSHQTWTLVLYYSLV